MPAPIRVVIQGVDQFTATIGKTLAGMDKLGKATTAVGKRMSLGLTLPIVAFGVSAIRSAGNFEAAMNRMGVVAKEVGGVGLDSLEKKARSLGETTEFTASQVGNAMENLAKAGQNTQQIAGSIGGTLSLAAAGGIEMSEAALIASKTMNNFNLKASDTVQIADVLTRVFSKAPTTIEEVGTAMVFGGNAASAMGLGLKDTAALLGVFAKQGEVGSLGGTKLRKVMNSLAKPTAQAIQTFNKLGIGFSDVFDKAADGTKTFKGMVPLIQQLEKGVFNLDDAVSIFGAIAGPLMFKTVKNGSGALQEMRDSMDDVGITAKKVAEANLKGFNGQMKKLGSAFESFQIALLKDTGLLQGLTKVFTKITTVIQKFAKASPGMLKLGLAIGAIIAVAGPLLVIVGSLISSFAVMGGVIANAGGIIALLSNPIGWIVLAIGGLIATLRLAGLSWKDIWRGMMVAFTPFSTIFVGLVEFIIENWARILPFFKLLMIGVVGVFKWFAGFIKPILDPFLWTIDKIIEGVKFVAGLGLAGLEGLADATLSDEVKKEIGFDPGAGPRTSADDFLSLLKGDGKPPPSAGSEILIKFGNVPKGTEIERTKGDPTLEVDSGPMP